MANLKKNLVVSITFLMGALMTATATQTNYNTKNTKGRPNKVSVYRIVSLCTDKCSGELMLKHTMGVASFTYYIYDESGCPVMSGSGEFDADGLFNVAIDTLPSGHYTVEVVINGSATLCSFFKM